jgi:hypothetical protein
MASESGNSAIHAAAMNEMKKEYTEGFGKK